MDEFFEGKVHQTECNLTCVAQQCGAQFMISSNRLIRAEKKIIAIFEMVSYNGLTRALVSQDNGEGHLYASALSLSCTVKEVKF